MSKDIELLDQAAKIFYNQLVRELNKPRQSRAYSSTFTGLVKPKNKSFPTPPPSPPKASGNLQRQLSVYWQEDFEDGKPNLVVDFGNADYWRFVDQGRKPNSVASPRTGAMKPALQRWARIKGLPQWRDKKGRFISYEAQAFLLMRSVANLGYGGTNFIENAITQIIGDVEDRTASAAEAYILKLFDEGRIFPRSDFNRP